MTEVPMNNDHESLAAEAAQLPEPVQPQPYPFLFSMDPHPAGATVLTIIDMTGRKILWFAPEAAEELIRQTKEALGQGPGLITPPTGLIVPRG